MLSGAHPLDELEIGLLRIAVDQPLGLMEQLRRDERGLLRAARLVLPTDRGELLLVIDQFEELFTRAADRAESEHLLRSLVAAVSDPRSRVRVVITLRADFYDRPLMHPDFGSLMRQRTEVVVPLTTEELARAIREPATRAPTVEVAHEALLREWGRLSKWLDESRADVRMQRLLATATREWIEANRDPSFLLRGSRLGQFEDWLTTTDLAPTQAERDYLDASLAERRAREAEDAARQAREKSLELRSRYFLRALATVVALGSAGMARRVQTVAEEEAPWQK